MAVVGSYRRYCLGKRLEARELRSPGLMLTWAAEQLAQPGTLLPDNFPNKTELAEFGYVANTDLVGADTEELIAVVGLNAIQAEAVIKAVAAL